MALGKASMGRLEPSGEAAQAVREENMAGEAFVIVRDVIGLNRDVSSASPRAVPECYVFRYDYLGILENKIRSQEQRRY